MKHHYALAAVAAVLAGTAACSNGTPASTGTPAATAAPASSTPASSAPASPTSASPSAQPETVAGVKAVAQQFYDLMSASQFGPAWDFLTPSVQEAIPRATWIGVHEGCPSAAAGMARVIKSVTVTGSTAIVDETVAGSLGSLATVSDAFTYTGGQWRYVLTDLSMYKHGSVAADVAALSAAGYCSGS